MTEREMVFKPLMDILSPFLCKRSRTVRSEKDCCLFSPSVEAAVLVGDSGDVSLVLLSTSHPHSSMFFFVKAKSCHIFEANTIISCFLIPICLRSNKWLIYILNI